MPIHLLISVLLAHLLIPKTGPDEILLPIHVDGKTGFVNMKGEVVIKPVFRKVGEFSEGVAPARGDGLYGFIDTKGVFVIPPKYDYAQPFSEGCAIVYNPEGYASCIDHSGKILFSTSFGHIEQFHHGCAIVHGMSWSDGLIDKKGKLISDTNHSGIGYVGEGLIAAWNGSKGVILDTLGNTVFELNDKTYIGTFHDGITDFHFQGDPAIGMAQGFMDAKGRILFEKDIRYPHRNGEELREGKLVVSLNADLHSSYEGVIDTSGNIIVDNPFFKTISSFEHDVAFAVGTDRKLCQIDQHGNLLRSFPDVNVGEQIRLFSFQHGKLLIGSITQSPKPQRYDYVLDSTGSILYHSTESTIRIARNPRYVTASNMGIPKEKIDIIDLQTGAIRTLVDKSSQSFVSQKHCIVVQRADSTAYFSYDGQLIFTEENEETFGDSYQNTDEKGNGYYHLFGDHYILDLRDVPLTSGEHKIKPDTGVSLFVSGLDTVRQVQPRESKAHIALKIILINNTSRGLAVSEYPSFTMQAKDRKGVWKDIEDEPYFSCGTGIRTVKMDPEKYVLFAGPIYEGSFKTKLRIRYDTITSNEFDGSVNPAQFWRNWRDGMGAEKLSSLSTTFD